MGQAHLWPQIGPIRVPRPVPGSILHETDTRNLIFWVPGTLGVKIRDLGLGWVGGPCMLYTPLLKSRSGAAPKSDLLLRAIYFQGGVPNPFLALKWSDLGPPTSGQVHWG